MEKNKTGKYLKYAVGEIVLVVIGILIALQINNWNEERKINKGVATLSKSMINELKTDIATFNEEIIFIESMIGKYSVVSDIVSKTKQGDVKEPLLSMVKFYGFRPNNATYKSAVASGFLGNHKDSIEIKIANYYEQDYTRLNEFAIFQSDYVKKLTDVLINEFPNINVSNEEFTFQSLDKLKTDRIVNLLEVNRISRIRLLRVLKETKEQAQQLITALEYQTIK